MYAQRNKILVLLACCIVPLSVSFSLATAQAATPAKPTTSAPAPPKIILTPGGGLPGGVTAFIAKLSETVRQLSATQANLTQDIATLQSSGGSQSEIGALNTSLQGIAAEKTLISNEAHTINRDSTCGSCAAADAQNAQAGAYNKQLSTAEGQLKTLLAAPKTNANKAAVKALVKQIAAIKANARGAVVGARAAEAANPDAPTTLAGVDNWGAIQKIIAVIGTGLIAIAAASVILLYMVSSLMFITARANRKQIWYAKGLAKRTTIGLGVIAAVYIIQSVTLGMAGLPGT